MSFDDEDFELEDEDEFLEGDQTIPFYVQICKIILTRGDILFLGTAVDKEPQIVRLEKGKWNIISVRELGRICKEILRVYLNMDNYKYLSEKAKRTKKYVTGINAGEVFIDAGVLAGAYKDNFSLSKEKKKLMEELFDTSELCKPETYFLPPKNILPFRNGFFDFKDHLLHDYGENSYKGFLYQLNADFLTGNYEIKLPDDLSKLIKDGLYVSTSSQDINENRLQSFFESVAYSFIPTNPFRKLFIIIGPTGCGKSTFVSILRTVFGSLGIHLQSYSIMRQNKYDHELRPDIKATMDKLWVDISETDEKQTIDAVTIKSYTGNDPLTYRKPHSDERTTKVMNSKIWLISNTFPKVLNYSDEALKDRLVVFDWHNTVRPEDRDGELYHRLTTDENRSKIATYFACLADDIYLKSSLSVDQTFQFNILRYFRGQGDLVVQFYDKLQKCEGYWQPCDANCISTKELTLLFVLFKNEINKSNEIITEPDARAFENKFAEIAKSDHFHVVERKKNAFGHYYQGIFVPPQYRIYGNLMPMNGGIPQINQTVLIT